MKRSHLIKKSVSGLMIFLICSTLEASMPLWSFKPFTVTTIAISSNEMATVQYEVTNQSRKTHTLAMQSIVGVSQIITTGNCSNPFTLEYQQSCILTLEIKGNLLQGNLIGGPIICQQGNLLQCYQPDRKHALNITQTTASSVATITSTSEFPAVLHGLNMNWLGDSPTLYTVFYSPGNSSNLTSSETPTGPITTTSIETDPYTWSGYSVAICPSTELSYNSINCSNVLFTH